MQCAECGAAWVFDVVRATIVVRNLAQLRAVWRRLPEGGRRAAVERHARAREVLRRGAREQRVQRVPHLVVERLQLPPLQQQLLYLQPSQLLGCRTSARRAKLHRVADAVQRRELRLPWEEGGCHLMKAKLV